MNIYSCTNEIEKKLPIIFTFVDIQFFGIFALYLGAKEQRKKCRKRDSDEEKQPKRTN